MLPTPQKLKFKRLVQFAVCSALPTQLVPKPTSTTKLKNLLRRIVVPDVRKRTIVCSGPTTKVRIGVIEFPRQRHARVLTSAHAASKQHLVLPLPRPLLRRLLHPRPLLRQGLM